MASQTVATATVLWRVSSRAPPRVAPAQLTTTPGVDRVEEAGEGAGAAGREVEADVGVVAAAERGELDGGVGEQAVGDEAAEVAVGSDQQDSHRAAPGALGAGREVVIAGSPSGGACELLRR
ncbi:hypothetical protein M2157_003478 [Streptomyces sp. SAI-127]|nr:hypothetical protein [Streptomyces sp. SAI-127]